MTDLQSRRLQVARDHMRLEITHEWEAVLATFEHPHYDINDGQAVFDGRDQVMRYFTQSRIPFPDQGNEVIAMAADVTRCWWNSGSPARIWACYAAATGSSNPPARHSVYG